MSWQVTIIILFSALFLLMLTGVPIAFSFLFIDLLGAFLLFGFPGGFYQMIHSMFGTLSNFTMAPIPLFVLMGEIMFISGLGGDLVNTVGQWMGKIPGRSAILAVAAGTLLATLTGAAVASVSILSNTLLPEMEKQHYDKSMIFGPILASGGLAVLIPPSVTAVILASLTEISVGKVLMAIIGPGILLAIVYVIYIVVRCTLHPELAPVSETPNIPLKEKLHNVVYNVLPVGFIIFAVIGVMMLGIASPEESAVTGIIATFLVATAQKRMSWQVINKSLHGTLRLAGTLFLIMGGAAVFGQVLAFTGATTQLSKTILDLGLPPIMGVFMMQLVMILMGCFMNPTPIIMICMPIFMPAIKSLGFDPIWFAAIGVVNLELGMITPPFGGILYAMKAAAPKYSMEDIIKSATPFIFLQVLTIVIVMIFPSIALWLPNR